MANEPLPDPPVPADLDLRHLGEMPLKVRTLRDSRIAAVASAEEFRAAVLLWAAAWHQVPAASLPDDDYELAQLAGFGRYVDEFRKWKAGALHRFVKCADGRLYHPIVADVAMEAWSRTQKAIQSGKAGANARWGNKKRHNGNPNANAMRPQWQDRTGQDRKGKEDSTELVSPTESKKQTPRVGTNAREAAPGELGLVLAPEPHREPQLAVQAWNALADELDKPKVHTPINDQRRKHLAARLHECRGLSGWELALAKVRDSPFLSGRTEHNFRVNFDWVINAANFAKIMEGNYDEKRNGNGFSKPLETLEKAARAFDRREGGTKTGGTDDRRGHTDRIPWRGKT